MFTHIFRQFAIPGLPALSRWIPNSSSLDNETDSRTIYTLNASDALDMELSLYLPTQTEHEQFMAFEASGDLAFLPDTSTTQAIGTLPASHSDSLLGYPFNAPGLSASPQVESSLYISAQTPPARSGDFKSSHDPPFPLDISYMAQPIAPATDYQSDGFHRPLRNLVGPSINLKSSIDDVRFEEILDFDMANDDPQNDISIQPTQMTEDTLPVLKKRY